MINILLIISDSFLINRNKKQGEKKQSLFFKKNNIEILSETSYDGIVNVNKEKKSFDLKQFSNEDFNSNNTLDFNF